MTMVNHNNAMLTRVLAILCLLCTLVVADNSAFDVYVNHPNSGGNVTVAVNVPSNSSDDLFFHFSASAKNSWAAFGFGQRMAGSLIFMAYAAEGGKNVTVSPRIATGHTPPQHTDDVQVTVLNGTTITSDGLFVVNAHCTGCRSWQGGNIDIKSTSQSMIYALGPSGNTLQSNDVSVMSIKQHQPGNYDTFSLDLQKATGTAGVPVLTSNIYAGGNSTNSNGTSDGGSTSDSDEDESTEFPIAVHAFFTLAVFLFVFPGGYLFLRVFDKVWLHAGIQSMGIVGLLAGTAAGIAYNVKQKIDFSYHQALGTLTLILVLAAFVLGLISHRYFKARGTPSPLMKFHRMVGPASIVLGWGTIMSGFAFRDEPRRIVPFIVVLLAVIIFVGGITFVMKKRKMRKATMTTPAAQNFNSAYYEGNNGSMPPPAYGQAQGYYAPGQAQDGHGVPMQTFHQGFTPAQQDPNKPPHVTVSNTQ